MKRFHVHVAVDELEASIRFYSSVFGVPPTVHKSDYAKWMIEDPRINFAISSRAARTGVDHLGFQVDSDEELTALRKQVADAEIVTFDQRQTQCCYARSDKYWITDPQGIAWETFHTLGEAQIYAADTATASESDTCCSPASDTRGAAARKTESASCC
jgi:catechol 2,3-dioxygenase-like lactoylglutathione lyase family enzyme